jgi:hypothetical protein
MYETVRYIRALMGTPPNKKPGNDPIPPTWSVFATRIFLALVGQNYSQ